MMTAPLLLPRRLITPFFLLLGCLFASAVVQVVQAAASVPYQEGEIAGSVVALQKDTYRIALNDPANSLWLLEFYAPWCGHCKKLVPVLDAVAPTLKGKMAIGTIDCTVEKNLCDENRVRGFPTLKFSLDGEIHDYPGGRQEKDFQAFAEKMARRTVQLVSSVQEANDKLDTMTEDGVAFLAYHPSIVDKKKGAAEAAATTVEDKVQLSFLTQVYAQVARKEKAYNTFFLLDSKDDGDDLLKTGRPFVCRLELGVPPRCYENVDEPEVKDLHAFVRQNSVATVSMLDAHNFHKVGKSGRPLVIAVVSMDHEEQVQTASKVLMRYASDGPKDVRERYYYGIFDGKAFQKFLMQFDVVPDELPQLLVLDVPTKEYWQNSTYGLNVDDFLAAVQDGTVGSKSAGAQGFGAFLKQIEYVMVEYRPWSVVLAVLILIIFGVLMLSILSPGADLRPPYRPEDVPGAKPAPAATKKDAKAPATEEKAAESEPAASDEPKKDK